MTPPTLTIWLCIMHFFLYRTTWKDLKSIARKHSRAKTPLQPQPPELPKSIKKLKIKDQTEVDK